MKIKLSKSQWEQIGKTAGWMKKAQGTIAIDTTINFEGENIDVIVEGQYDWESGQAEILSVHDRISTMHTPDGIINNVGDFSSTDYKDVISQEDLRKLKSLIEWKARED